MTLVRSRFPTLRALALAIILACPAVAAAQTVPLDRLAHLHGLAVDPTDPRRLHAIADSGALLASGDGGTTWGGLGGS